MNCTGQIRNLSHENPIPSTCIGSRKTHRNHESVPWWRHQQLSRIWLGKSAASDPKKVLYYDTGHDLNDPQALEDRYDWLVNNISLRRESVLTRLSADARRHQLRTWRRLPEGIPVCPGLLMGDFSPDSMRPWKAQHSFCVPGLEHLGPNQDCPLPGKRTAQHARDVE